MITFYDCPICGQKVSKALNNCPNCGCPTTDMIRKEEPPRINPKPVKKSKSKAPIMAIVAVVVAALAVAAYFIIKKLNDDKKDEKKQSDQKIEQTTKSTESAVEDAVTQYMKDYTHTYGEIMRAAEKTEDFGRFYQHVWVDSIYKEDNEETNKYTKDENGEFYEDFNDALGKIWSVEDNYLKYKDISDAQSEVQSLMKKLINPPEECKEAYNAIKELYDHYIEFSNLVINPSGQSLQSYTDNFRDADTATANSIDKVKIYIDD
ncbi:MAG: hypothetical protein IJJ74_09430 [Eubacterium sp.]|nr:hypothetical protein [Eubacterium sp.]